MTIGQRTESNQRRIETLEQKLDDLSHAVTLLLAEQRHAREHERAEREKQEPRSQLALERLEHRLPSPSLPPPTGEPGR